MNTRGKRREGPMKIQLDPTLFLETQGPSSPSPRLSPLPLDCGYLSIFHHTLACPRHHSFCKPSSTPTSKCRYSIVTILEHFGNLHNFVGWQTSHFCLVSTNLTYLFLKCFEFWETQEGWRDWIRQIFMKSQDSRPWFFSRSMEREEHLLGERQE